MSRVLLVGEAPTTATESRPELWLLPNCKSRPEIPRGQAANRLLCYTGWSRERYLATFRRTNLIPHAVGERWPAEEAAPGVEHVLEHLSGGGRALLLGARVARSVIGSGGYSVLRWMLLGGGHVAVCPHPSGRSLWWNDDANRARARIFFSGPEFPDREEQTT